MKKLKSDKIFSEREIQQQIISYLRYKDYYFWRNNVGRKKNLQFGLKGSADLIGLTKNGIFFAVEVKDDKGKMSSSQKTFEKNVNANNGIYILARSVEDVAEIL